MNSTRGSTPPNPNLDLSNRSTDLNKTLGMIGTPHEESIAIILSTKTCQIKRNRRNPTKNSSNPRAPKNPKIEPLNSRIWEGNHWPKNHEGFPQISPHQIPKSKVPKTPQENHQERTPKITTKNNQEQHNKALRNHANHLYILRRFIQGLACRPIIQPSHMISP
jgi:hypothetical protein